MPAAPAEAAELPRYLQRKVLDSETGIQSAVAHGLPRYLQAKLAISQPGDAHEQQADRVAEQVMRMPSPAVQRQCAACDGGAPCAKCAGEQAQIQRKADAHQAAPRAADAGGAVSHLGGGQALDPATRAFFEPRLGYDFSQVRVHANGAAGQSARDLNARAYTVGRDVVFGAGQFAPSTQAGRQLLAHELTHVMQQSGAVPLGDHAASVPMQSPMLIQRDVDKDPAALDDDQLKSEYDAYNSYIHTIDPKDYPAEEGNMQYFQALEKELRKRCLKDAPDQPKDVSQTLIDRITGKFASVDGDPGEGMISTPYVAAEGQCTIGYGHVIFPKSLCSIESVTDEQGKVTKKCNCQPPWNAITKQKATDLLKQDIQTHVGEVRKKIKVNLNQAEFDAMVDLSAHVGSLPQDFVNTVHEHWCTNKDRVKRTYLVTAIKMKDPDTKQMKVMKNFVERRKRRVW